ncbi:MAG: Ribosomal large subunit pseudouridine synthase D [Clostridiales bacterium 38_11]|nr:MAG: Ribosomal large subunit pseudouridine synthase D [Clostridiales bacterium 38_11]HBH12351.1 RluA family pseudouridine synthase [Clostridiales bacterium]
MNNDTMVLTCRWDSIKARKLLEDYYGFSSKLINKLELEGLIQLEGRKIKLNKSLYSDDVVTVDFADEEDEYAKIRMDLNIIFEDEDLLILNKQPFIVVHPTRRHQDDTIANGVSYYFFENQIRRKVRFVNRLDMNTTGVLIIAKNPYAHNMISQEMRRNKVKKTYLAVLDGILTVKEDTINQNIGRIGDNIKREVHESGKACITHYKVLEENKGLTLVEIFLETGRTHQIRVHFDFLNAPVLGDNLYGKTSHLINRQALHCQSIEMVHPRTKELIRVEADLPEDMQSLLK